MGMRGKINPFSKTKGTKNYNTTIDKFNTRIASKDPSLDPLAIRYSEKAKAGISAEVQEMEDAAKWGEISEGADAALRDIIAGTASSGVRGGIAARQLAESEAAVVGEYAGFKGDQAAADIAEKDKYRIISEERISDLEQEKSAAQDDLAAFEDDVERYDNEQEQSLLEFVSGQQVWLHTAYQSFFNMAIQNPDLFEDASFSGWMNWMEDQHVDTSYIEQIGDDFDWAKGYFDKLNVGRLPGRGDGKETTPGDDNKPDPEITPPTGNKITTTPCDYTATREGYPSGDG